MLALSLKTADGKKPLHQRKIVLRHNQFSPINAFGFSKHNLR